MEHSGSLDQGKVSPVIQSGLAAKKVDVMLQKLGLFCLFYLSLLTEGFKA